MNLLSYFSPQLIAAYHSKINGEIKVVEYFGRKAVYVDGAPQSGAEITPMWEKIISNIKNPCLAGRQEKSEIRNCLILGIGGGNVIKILKEQYPKIVVTAVEVDPVMVEIAEKYFHLETSNIHIVIADAISWVKNYVEEKLDLIVVDLFVGKLNPLNSRGRDFLVGLKNLKTVDGIIIYNSHYQKDNPDEFKRFKNICKLVFPYVSEIFAYRNNRVVKLKSHV